jgi:hypothetical protein
MNNFVYEVVKSDDGSEMIKRTDSNGLATWIPKDQGNSDYLAYLESLNDDSEAE